jgi:hypothetical protein
MCSLERTRGRILPLLLCVVGALRGSAVYSLPVWKCRRVEPFTRSSQGRTFATDRRKQIHRKFEDSESVHRHRVWRCLNLGVLP